MTACVAWLGKVSPVGGERDDSCVRVEQECVARWGRPVAARDTAA